MFLRFLSDHWLPISNVIIIFCSVIMVTLMWRQDRRYSKADTVSIGDQKRILRSSIVSRTVSLLYVNLIAIRHMYIHLSEEDRLQAELDLMFGKPEVIDAIANYHFDLFEFDNRSRRLNRLKLTQRLCTRVGALCVVGFVVLWAISLQDEDIVLSMGSWLLLAGALVATLVFGGSSIYAHATERRLAKLARHETGTGTG